MADLNSQWMGWEVVLLHRLVRGHRNSMHIPLDRPNIREDGSVDITQRSDRRRQYDKEFKTILLCGTEDNKSFRIDSGYIIG